MVEREEEVEKEDRKKEGWHVEVVEEEVKEKWMRSRRCCLIY